MLRTRKGLTQIFGNIRCPININLEWLKQQRYYKNHIERGLSELSAL